MATELVSTAATAWTLVWVAGLGVAVLPWADREAREVVAAFAALPSVVRGACSALARARSLAPVGVLARA